MKMTIAIAVNVERAYSS